METEAAVNSALAEQTSFQVLSPPGSGLALFIIGDVNAGLWAKTYNGAAWANTEGGSALDGSVFSSLGVPFGAWVR